MEAVENGNMAGLRAMLARSGIGACPIKRQSKKDIKKHL
jgi:hypothetical protein